MIERPDWDQFAKDLADDWQRPSPWSLSGSVDVREKGIEIDIEHGDPNKKEDEG